jgi:hypothetical protein
MPTVVMPFLKDILTPGKRLSQGSSKRIMVPRFKFYHLRSGRVVIKHSYWPKQQISSPSFWNLVGDSATFNSTYLLVYVPACIFNPISYFLKISKEHKQYAEIYRILLSVLLFPIRCLFTVTNINDKLA